MLLFEDSPPLLIDNKPLTFRNVANNSIDLYIINLRRLSDQLTPGATIGKSVHCAGVSCSECPLNNFFWYDESNHCIAPSCGSLIAKLLGLKNSSASASVESIRSAMSIIEQRLLQEATYAPL